MSNRSRIPQRDSGLGKYRRSVQVDGFDGVHVYAAVMKRLFPKLSDAKDVPKVIRDVVESGGRGISNLRGFYRYTSEEARQWKHALNENVLRVRAMQAELFKEMKHAADH